MTDQLNEAGVEAAAKTIRPLISDEMRAHSTEYSVARAAITAYLDCERTENIALADRMIAEAIEICTKAEPKKDQPHD